LTDGKIDCAGIAWHGMARCGTAWGLNIIFNILLANHEALLRGSEGPCVRRSLGMLGSVSGGAGSV